MSHILFHISLASLTIILPFFRSLHKDTPNIPRALYHRLSQLRHSRVRSCRPCYVSLGTRERYFVAFHDGSFAHSRGLPPPLDRALRQLSHPPASVAFGGPHEAYLLVLADGTWNASGSGGNGGGHNNSSSNHKGQLPADLDAKLVQFRRDQTRLACATLGPAGEWFLRSRDGGRGRVSWGGVSSELDGAVHELLAADRRINFLDFGENGSYFVSYD